MYMKDLECQGGNCPSPPGPAVHGPAWIIERYDKASLHVVHGQTCTLESITFMQQSQTEACHSIDYNYDYSLESKEKPDINKQVCAMACHEL